MKKKNLNHELYFNDINFKFVLNENDIYIDIKTKYTISIEETYSSACQINLIIIHNDII